MRLRYKDANYINSTKNQSQKSNSSEPTRKRPNLYLEVVQMATRAEISKNRSH